MNRDVRSATLLPLPWPTPSHTLSPEVPLRIITTEMSNWDSDNEYVLRTRPSTLLISTNAR
jgi:hypothetical protein